MHRFSFFEFSRRGFTLIELLIFGAIFSAIAVVFVGILVSVTRIHVRQGASAEVNQQTQFLIQILQRHIERSSLVELATDTPTSTLKLRMASTTADPTYIYLATSTVYLKETTAGVPQALTSERVSVPTLTFTKRVNPGGRDAVAIAFTISHNTQNVTQQFSKSISTAIARTGPAVFASDVVPQTSDVYRVGTTTRRWRSINDVVFFSNANVGVKTTNPNQTLEIQGGVRLNTGTAKPACNSATATEGTFWVTQGGENVSDTAEVCVKNASDAYQWVSIFREAWALTTDMPSSRYFHAAVAYNNHLYLSGGSDFLGDSTSSVMLAPIQADGTLGAWTMTTPLPFKKEDHSSVAHNGYIYVLGGYGTNSESSTVLFAPINGDGTLGTWATTTPTAYGGNGRPVSAVYNNYLYVIGGIVYQTTSTVIYAPINPNGTLGSWQETTPLPAARDTFGIGVVDGHVYVIAGASLTEIATSSVFYAQFNANGTIGPWIPTLPLPGPLRSRAGVAVRNKFIYTIGGSDGLISGTTSTVNVASVNADHTLSSWSLAKPYPFKICCRGAVVSSTYIYVTGGRVINTSGSLVPTRRVRYAPISSDGTVVGF